MLKLESFLVRPLRKKHPRAAIPMVSSTSATPRSMSLTRWYVRVGGSVAVAGLLSGLLVWSGATTPPEGHKAQLVMRREAQSVAPAEAIAPVEHKSIIRREPHRSSVAAEAAAPAEHKSIIRREPKQPVAAASERPSHCGSMMRREPSVVPVAALPVAAGAPVSSDRALFRVVGCLLAFAALFGFAQQTKAYVVTLMKLHPSADKGKSK